MRIGSLVVASAVALAAVACNNEQKNNPPPPPSPSTANTTTTTTSGAVTNTGATASTDPIANADNRASLKVATATEKVVPTQERIVVSQVILRDAPRGGSLGMAKSGDVVTEVGREGDYVLGLLPDPDHSGKEMAAWIYKDAFLNPKPLPEKGAAAAKGKTGASEKPMTCAKGESSVRTDHDFCAKQCSSDADCKASNGVCDGAAILATEKAGAEKGVKYCVGETGRPSGTWSGNAEPRR